MQYVAAGVDSVAHRHELVYVWETLIVKQSIYVCIYSCEKTTYSGLDLIECLSKPSALFKSIANVILHTSDL